MSIVDMYIVREFFGCQCVNAMDGCECCVLVLWK